MRVFNGITALPEFKNGVLTIGTFDGVHIGHQQILKQMREAADQINGETILLTFHPHPRLVLQPDSNIQLINTIEEKAVILEKFGLDNFIIVPFTADFSQMTPESYIQDFLYKNIRPKKIIIGYDHRFGQNRSGGINTFKKMAPQLGYTVDEISAQAIENITVSSTKVRKALAAGEIETANALLGHTFFISGNVVKGRQIGRSIGFPTANVVCSSQHKLIPANGVYAVEANITGEKLYGMVNIGHRPTFDNGEKTIEAHLFDFNGDLYDRQIELYFLKFIRKEEKFDDQEALQAQLEKDKVVVLKLLKKR